MSFNPTGALLSDCRQYRYVLWRVWDPTKPKLLWIMLNPSTASEEVDDATIRVCKGRARYLGYGGIIVVNLFGLRTTDPDKLYRHPSPVSAPDDSGANDGAIYTALQSAKTVICAWGKHGSLHNRGPQMLKWLHKLEVRPRALRINSDGSPAHPLRISYSQPLKRM